ncbi:MAG: 16S rRNA (uracil(1498)-N(3))-methyltransferase [Akkermansiaceae bacterium]
MNRYFLQAGAWDEHTLTLTDEEAHHATRVMRVNEGEKVELFDGEGQSAICTVTQATRQSVECKVESTNSQPRDKHPITLCQAIPKGGNMELIVQKAVELGVSEILPLITAHTVARPEALSKKREKWQRIALEACKQCGQNHLPNILTPATFSEWIKTDSTADTKLIAALDPQAQHLKKLLEEKPITGSVDLLVGPEGDFSPSEYSLAYGVGYTPISFGDIVLRVETATLYGLSILRHELSAIQWPHSN